ncbi:MAG: ABC transporter ATP-binding protein [Actinomycetes bacterium]
MTTPLVLEGLFAGYGDVPVVRNLNLHVASGEVVALLGPNGAGKTTTLLTISGLIKPLGGAIDVLGGGPPSVRRPQEVAKRGLAHVPEGRSLFMDLTVRENLRLGQARRRFSRRASIDQALDYFPALSSLLDRKAGLLSGGEQQMLALGRAIVSEPKLLVVDELSLGLAPIIVERILPVMRRVADDTGAGVILVEQHVHLALQVADRAYVLNHGEVVLEGAAQDLANQRELLASSYLGATVL